MKILVASILFVVTALAARASETTEQVLAEINLARTQPKQYAQILAATMERSSNSRDVQGAIRFLESVRPLAPLSFSTGLSQGAMLHIQEQGPTGGRGHGNPFSRMNRYGQWIGTAGENIYYGRSGARAIVCALIVDVGVMGKGHRKNIFSSGFGVAGAAYGSHAVYGAMCVIDFAGRYVERGSNLAGI